MATATATRKTKGAYRKPGPSGMGVYRDRHGLWRYEFQRDGVKYQRSCIPTAALAAELRAKKIAEVLAGGAPPPKPSTARGLLSPDPEAVAAIRSAKAAAGEPNPRDVKPRPYARPYAGPPPSDAARAARLIVEAWDARDWRWLMGDDDGDESAQV